MKIDSSLVNQFFSSITPEHSFSEKKPPKAPDYNNKNFWVAFPGKKSVALLDPERESTNELKGVDCFFIHPTGFFLKEWNYDLDLNSAGLLFTVYNQQILQNKFAPNIILF